VCDGLGVAASPDRAPPPAVILWQAAPPRSPPAPLSTVEISFPPRKPCIPLWQKPRPASEGWDRLERPDSQVEEAKCDQEYDEGDCLSGFHVVVPFHVVLFQVVRRTVCGIGGGLGRSPPRLG